VTGQPHPPPGRRVPDDVERAAERVSLAWQRSALSLGGVGLLMTVRIVPISRSRPLAGFLVAGVAGAFVAAGLAFRRQQRRHGPPSRHVMFLVTLGTVGVGLLALGVALAATP
jgi:uncharacterized membrane protein YidH (DUF202 family)